MGTLIGASILQLDILKLKQSNPATDPTFGRYGGKKVRWSEMVREKTTEKKSMIGQYWYRLFVQICMYLRYISIVLVVLGVVHGVEECKGAPSRPSG